MQTDGWGQEGQKEVAKEGVVRKAVGRGREGEDNERGEQREREGRRYGGRKGIDRRSRGQGGEEVRPGPGCLVLK